MLDALTLFVTYRPSDGAISAVLLTKPDLPDLPDASDPPNPSDTFGFRSLAKEIDKASNLFGLPATLPTIMLELVSRFAANVVWDCDKHLGPMETRAYDMLHDKTDVMTLDFLRPITRNLIKVNNMLGKSERRLGALLQCAKCCVTHTEEVLRLASDGRKNDLQRQASVLFDRLEDLTNDCEQLLRQVHHNKAKIQVLHPVVSRCSRANI